MEINNYNIENFKKPFFIAEIGANHNGDIKLAKKMIDIAKESGADCVKFQSWSKDSIFSKKVYEDNYFLKDDYRDRDDYTLEEIVDEFSLAKEEQKMLKEYCDKVGIMFASTPFSKGEVDFLVHELDVDFIKVASMDLNNIPFLEYIAKKNKPIFLSTGLSTLSEIDEAVRAIENAGNKDIIILHCVAMYPPKDNIVNLNNIDTFMEIYEYPIGYSDHTLGTTASLVAVSKGACVIEKHFTLDKNMFGWDHKVSVDPDEMKYIISESERIVSMLGSKRRIVYEEKERIEAFRRSIVASKDIAEGEIITREHIEFKRPGTGIEPKYYKFIIGKKAKRNIKYDEIIKMEDF